MRVLRGNRWIQVADHCADPCWNREDLARYYTLLARFQHRGREAVECMVWKAKFPGLVYNDTVEKLIVE